MAGEQEQDFSSSEPTKNAVVDYPWWVKSYSRFLNTGHLIFLTLVVGITYSYFDGEKLNISLR